MEFKDRLKYLRYKNNIPHAQLAMEFEKTESAIRSWELGRTKPDADTLIKLARYFNCSTDYLLGLSEHMSIGDFQSSVKRTDRLVRNIEKLHQGDAERFTSILNACLEAMAESPLLHESDDNEIFYYWMEILNSFLIMCDMASVVNDSCKVILPEDISPLITFIKSKGNFDAPINRLYADFANMILDNVQNFDMKEKMKLWLHT